MPRNSGTSADPGRRILVLGVGNSILKDEGFGVHVVQELAKQREQLGIPPNVELMDGATLGLDLLYYMEGRDKIILIDIVNAGAEPGEIFKFTPHDIKTKNFINKVSMHQVTLFDVLTMAEITDRLPDEVVLIAVQPGEINWGEELTPAVAAQIPRVIELIMEELAS
ncbi:MAG: HyaD/HybD family hydrogenase maturation endopeptidase [Actinomycetota bacterium]